MSSERQHSIYGELWAETMTDTTRIAVPAGQDPDLTAAAIDAALELLDRAPEIITDVRSYDGPDLLGAGLTAAVLRNSDFAVRLTSAPLTSNDGGQTYEFIGLTERWTTAFRADAAPAPYHDHLFRTTLARQVLKAVDDIGTIHVFDVPPINAFAQTMPVDAKIYGLEATVMPVVPGLTLEQLEARLQIELVLDQDGEYLQDMEQIKKIDFLDLLAMVRPHLLELGYREAAKDAGLLEQIDFKPMYEGLSVSEEGTLEGDVKKVWIIDP